MDDRKPALPPDEPGLWSASGRPSAAVRSPLHDLVGPERQSRSAQIEPCQTELCQTELCQTDIPEGDSVVVYYGSEEAVAQGFLIALRAMGVAGTNSPLSLQKLPLGRAKP